MLYLVICNYPIADGLLVLFQIMGVILGIWAILSIGINNFHIQPEVKSDALVTKGPYKWIRNPMYTAVILFFMPIVIQNLGWLNILVFTLLVLTLILKILSEELFLKERFGEDYKEYFKSTKRLIPFIF